MLWQHRFTIIVMVEELQVLRWCVSGSRPGWACSCGMPCTGHLCMISSIPGTIASMEQHAASAWGSAYLCGLGCCYAALVHCQHCVLPGSHCLHVQVQSPTLSLPAGSPGRMKRRETASVLRWASLSMWSCCRSRQQMQRQRRWCSLGTTGPMTEHGRRNAKRSRRHPYFHGQPLAQKLLCQSLLPAQSGRDQSDMKPGQSIEYFNTICRSFSQQGHEPCCAKAPVHVPADDPFNSTFH